MLQKLPWANELFKEQDRLITVNKAEYENLLPDFQIAYGDEALRNYHLQGVRVVLNVLTFELDICVKLHLSSNRF